MALLNLINYPCTLATKAPFVPWTVISYSVNQGEVVGIVVSRAR